MMHGFAVQHLCEVGHGNILIKSSNMVYTVKQEEEAYEDYISNIGPGGT